MSNEEVWHRIVKKSWWDGSMITVCGKKLQNGESDIWYLPRTGTDCPACERLAN